MGKEERDVSGQSYEGKLYTEGKFEVLGPQHSGQRFDADLMTEYGKMHLRFLVSEKTNKYNTYSKN